ncbi:MAG: hypothetical protein ACTSYD_07420 [Candidatus Heimdallarchaeaceae archaeon]
MKIRNFRYLIIFLGLLICIILFGSLIAFILTHQHTHQPNIYHQVTVIINYDSLRDPPEEIHNLTILDGSTALGCFSQIAQLDLVNYSFGVYIRGVNGYYESLPEHYWAFYYYDFHTFKWVYSNVGVSNYFITHDDKLKLEYV